ncbi:hypothetical protein GP644_12885 [Parasedimentitalea maritima]|uniref:Methyltransferase domain-containing protein n=1 Tax=Parasedimentitalea maritima TaxID=2578117 RepID=A0A6A4RFJ1_9RHOB|nr:hypothetical protein GP644_12885 [Zongyanglinia marina]
MVDKRAAQSHRVGSNGSPSYENGLSLRLWCVEQKDSFLGRLREFFDAHDGKVSDKWRSYWPAYETVMRRFQKRAVRVLEIGVQNGGSLEIWSKYFPKAHHIIGCDIDPACGTLEFDADNISVVIGDAAEPETYERIDAICDSFDIIIDDGSHHCEHIISAFPHVFERLKVGGVYICEDLHSSYFDAMGGGLERPDSAWAFFRRLSDYVNLEHWHQPGQHETPMRFFEERYGLSLPIEMLAHVHEVRVVNSVCIVEKRAPEDNLLGPREMRGQVAAVNGAILENQDVTARECVQITEADLRLPGKSIERVAHETHWEDIAADHQSNLLALRAEIEQMEIQHQKILDANAAAHQETLRENAVKIAQLDEDLEGCQAALAHADQVREALECELAEAQTTLERSQISQAAKLEHLETVRRDTQARLEAVQASLSWRVTTPLRRLANSLGRSR